VAHHEAEDVALEVAERAAVAREDDVAHGAVPQAEHRAELVAGLGQRLARHGGGAPLALAHDVADAERATRDGARRQPRVDR
jgi:hypothetical protein